MDIGPKTVKLFSDIIKNGRSIMLNGPLGVFELEKFGVGTYEVIKAMAESEAITIIGGGDSAAVAHQSGLADQITHISTGGGASLAFIGGLELPGITCLDDK
jgi:phosphoglycerate kinase